MNSQDFLILNLVGAGAFMLWYLVSRGGGRRPTRLDMHAKDTEPVFANAEPISPVAPTVQRASGAVRRQAESSETKAKNLNIMFNYNGHSWDAYEVLGVPAGASLQIVTEAYQKAILDSKVESAAFLEAAYKSILNKVV